jgi:hypothetical protein
MACSGVLLTPQLEVFAEIPQALLAGHRAAAPVDQRPEQASRGVSFQDVFHLAPVAA